MLAIFGFGSGTAGGDASVKGLGRGRAIVASGVARRGMAQTAKGLRRIVSVLPLVEIDEGCTCISAPREIQMASRLEKFVEGATRLQRHQQCPAAIRT